MSKEALHAFLARCEVDDRLRVALASAKHSGDVLAVAHDAGFDVRADDFEERLDRDLSDEELEAESGGAYFTFGGPCKSTVEAMCTLEAIVCVHGPMH